ncbi:trypsin-like peptidase domain-containing protein [Aeoliella sp. ICT_H6.2]|uniref:Trypsin-like peptidase domain-containing protein n=1 Tax=Aeoliella straminimaris TaxID=2954799 RepID=A0A9X2JG07_9BACT|nr:trypsin-like peptidase domain-containing protein [Aeoliella straminimaris]MCO6044590.1 trypsin-like peptidase domain-containing protein [Aeoliella straminimaris]
MSASASDYDPLPDPPPPRHNYPSNGDGTRGLRLLVVLLAVLVVILAGPYLLSRFRYADTRARMQAEVDVASTQLTKVRAELSDLVTASRLVAKRVSPSVVSIHRADIQGIEGQGSGVIVDPEGYIVTNYHVLEGATGLHVILADGRVEYEPVVVGGDMRIDLALLKINKSDLIAADWGDSDQLQVGDLVWAVGSPFGLDHTVTFGIVSAKQRRTLSQRSLQGGLQSNPFQEFLQTDVAVNPGNSGGPLVDLDGNIVGINTAIVGQVYQGISLAIPSNLAKDTYERLKTDGWIERGYLGVSPQPVDDRLRRRLGLQDGEGVLAATVSAFTPAERAGLQRGDVILKWNEHNASDPFLLTQAIADTPVGSKARLKICRLVRSQPEELDLEVTVGAAPRLERLSQ